MGESDSSNVTAQDEQTDSIHLDERPAAGDEATAELAPWRTTQGTPPGRSEQTPSSPRAGEEAPVVPQPAPAQNASTGQPTVAPASLVTPAIPVAPPAQAPGSTQTAYPSYYPYPVYPVYPGSPTPQGYPAGYPPYAYPPAPYAPYAPYGTVGAVAQPPTAQPGQPPAGQSVYPGVYSPGYGQPPYPYNPYAPYTPYAPYAPYGAPYAPGYPAYPPQPYPVPRPPKPPKPPRKPINKKPFISSGIGLVALIIVLLISTTIYAFASGIGIRLGPVTL
ncbi:MAG TPA: hypothetical protein VKQ36_15405, partial [Ktedonobacterales bacterium]|nr:hypothetical protein [Ktedonobacterales bacterium]